MPKVPELPEYRMLAAMFSNKYDLSIEATQELYNILYQAWIDGRNDVVEKKSKTI